jgi:hypothetical protein
MVSLQSGGTRLASNVIVTFALLSLSRSFGRPVFVCTCESAAACVVVLSNVLPRTWKIRCTMDSIRRRVTFVSRHIHH